MSTVAVVPGVLTTTRVDARSVTFGMPRNASSSTGRFQDSSSATNAASRSGFTCQVRNCGGLAGPLSGARRTTVPSPYTVTVGAANAATSGTRKLGAESTRNRTSVGSTRTSRPVAVLSSGVVVAAPGKPAAQPVTALSDRATRATTERLMATGRTGGPRALHGGRPPTAHRFHDGACSTTKDAVVAF